jgi:hypothetical protein
MFVREAFDWLKPSPLWQNGVTEARRADFFQPQLLEFDDDNFIAAFRRVAKATDPAEFRATVRIGTPDEPLKLYQPAHGRFYLVVAALACRMPGFPERIVGLGDGENVFFVMRRMVAGAEFGWVVDGTGKSWQPLGGDTRRLLDNEERLPLFQAAGADQRTILVGYIPTASREVYSVSVQTLNANLSDAERAHFPNGIDLRIEELGARFTTPLKKQAAQINISPPGAPDTTALISVYLLLDLLDFLATYLPEVAAALSDPSGTPATGLSAAGHQLMATLAAQSVGGGPSLDLALRALAAKRAELETPPDAGPDMAALGFAGYNVTTGAINTDAVETAVRNALPTDNSLIELPRQSGAPGETYVLRCVYERPQCSPPLRVVSLRSEQFELANFFDADAPARPVRIVMPTDVSLAGIRKFKKGVTFMISSSLQQKINMVTGHESDMLQKPPAPGPGDGNGIAWVCSFSFQIIFIVAFFLLLMFVIILNIVFWWIAFFRICIPLPKKLLTG